MNNKKMKISEHIKKAYRAGHRTVKDLARLQKSHTLIMGGGR